MVDFVKKWLVSTPRACIVEQGRFVGWVDLVALARIGDDQRAATTRPRRATTRATTPDDDDEMSDVVARVVARRRGLVEEASETPAAPAPDDLQAPAAPALDDSWSRVARFVGQGRPFFAKRTAAAVCMRVGTSQAFEEAVAARVEDHRKINFTTMRNVDGGSDLEAQTVIDMLTPDFRNLAVAELLGDAAPSASSPRALTHEELVAGLARFELGEVDAVHAEARNRIEARAAAPDAMQS